MTRSRRRASSADALGVRAAPGRVARPGEVGLRDGWESLFVTVVPLHYKHSSGMAQSGDQGGPTVDERPRFSLRDAARQPQKSVWSV
jgi:hypothetical protein